MGKISIISNISSKKHAGAPFCVIDYKKNCKIENDKISISMINTTRKTADVKRRNAEGEYLSILQTAYSFSITNDILTIYTTFRDEPLIYEEIKY